MHSFFSYYNSFLLIFYNTYYIISKYNLASNYVHRTNLKFFTAVCALHNCRITFGGIKMTASLNWKTSFTDTKDRVIYTYSQHRIPGVSALAHHSITSAIPSLEWHYHENSFEFSMAAQEPSPFLPRQLPTNSPAAMLWSIFRTRFTAQTIFQSPQETCTGFSLRSATKISFCF